MTFRPSNPSSDLPGNGARYLREEFQRVAVEMSRIALELSERPDQIEIVFYESDAQSDQQPDVAAGWNDYADRNGVEKPGNVLLYWTWPSVGGNVYLYAGDQSAPPWSTVVDDWKRNADQVTVWGSIIGQLSDQTDLQGALDAKADQADFAQHVGNSGIHYPQTQIDHTLLQNVGDNTHANIDAHISNGGIHYPQSAIDHTLLQNVGNNTHAAIDSHIDNGSIHFEDAPADGDYYARRNNAWSQDPIFLGGGQGAGWVPDPGPNIRGYFLEDSGNFETVPIQPVSTPTGKYNNLGTTPAGDPGSGNLSVNNTDPALVTEGYVSRISRLGNDVGFIWNRVDRGDILAVFATGGNSNVNFWRVTATPVNNGSWYLVPVEAVDFSGALPNNEVEIFFISRQVQDGTANGQMLIWDEAIDRLWTPTNAITVEDDGRVELAAGDLRGGDDSAFELRVNNAANFLQLFGGNDSVSGRLVLHGSSRGVSTSADFYWDGAFTLSHVHGSHYWHFRDAQIDYARQIVTRTSDNTVDQTVLNPSSLRFNRSVSYIEQARDGAEIQFRMSNGGDRNVNSATIRADGSWRFRVNRILIGENTNDEAFVSVRDNRAQFGYDGSSAFIRGGSPSNPKGLQFEVGDGDSAYSGAAYFSPSSLEWNFLSRRLTNLANPANARDAATKEYVDGNASPGPVAIAGLSGSSGAPWGPVVGCTFTKLSTGNYSLTLNNPLPFAGAWHCSISTDSEAEPYVTGFFTDGSTSNVRIYVKNAANQFVDPGRVTVMVYDKSKYQ